MGSYRSIRSRGRRRRISGDLELQLTSLMDILVIIVVFLLKSYATSAHTFTSQPGLQMPYSISQDVPPDSLYVTITPEAITFESARILEFVQSEPGSPVDQAQYQLRQTDLDEGGRRIIPLFDALTKAKEKAEILREKSSARDETGKPLPFEGVLAIQADKRIRYDTIRKIMYTAATAGYKTFRFLATRKEI